MYQEQLNKSTELELKLGDLEAQVKKTTEQLQHESQAKQKVVRDSQAAFQKADELTQANVKLKQNVAEFRNQVQQSGFHSQSQAQAVTDLKSKIAALQGETMQLDTKLSQSTTALQAAAEAAKMQLGAVQEELKTALKENESLATKMETLRKLNDEAGASANAVVEAKYKEATVTAAASEARALAAEAQVKKLESSKKGEEISKQAQAQAKLLQLDLDDAKEELARTATELEELKAAMEGPSAATSPDGESDTATNGGDDMGKMQALLAAERKAKKNLDAKLVSAKDALKAQIATAEAAASDSVAEATRLTKLASELEMKVSLLKENFDDERRRNDSRVTKLDVELSRAKESENDAITARARIQERLDELEDMMKGDDSQLLAESRASNQQLEHKWLTAESNLQERQTQLKKAYHQIDELREALERSRGSGGGGSGNVSVPDHTGSESGFSIGSTGARSTSKSHYGQSPAGPHGRRRPAPPPGPPSSARRGKPPPPQMQAIPSQGTPMRRPPMGQYGTPRGAQAPPMARNLTPMQAQNIARMSPAQQAARANANANAAASPLRPSGPPPHPGAISSPFGPR
jgi:chromosome segregation ATPase